MHNPILPLVRPREVSLPPNPTLVSSALANGRPPAFCTPAKGRPSDFPKSATRPAVLDRLLLVRPVHLLDALTDLALCGTACLLAALILHLVNA